MLTKNMNSSVEYEAESIEPDSLVNPVDLHKHFNSSVDVAKQLWHQEKRRNECYQIILAEMTPHSDDEPFCPTIWDDILCWPKAKAGFNFNQSCPDYVNGFNPNETASKFCTENGTWFVHPEKNSTWTDYSNCIKHLKDIPENDTTITIIHEWIPVIKRISQFGYGISFVTLLLAFFILVSIKKLRCPRNTLHIHLFLSFMLRAFVSLLKDALFVEGFALSTSLYQERDAELDQQSLIFKYNQSNWECKLVTSLWQYFLVANYTWILMEGLYLHNLIFLAPFSDSSAITLYVALGWGCPLIVVASWVTARALLDDTYCWTTHDNKELFHIIRIPIIISIVLNFLFFLNIVRVLLLKLQSAVSIETRKYRYRKWAKSTLVLVPLFGVHYMLFLWMSTYVGKNPVIEVTWLFCDQFFASFQGFFVSILYCLINGEVRSELNKKWSKWREDIETKNVWVPLNQISSKFYHRSTHDDQLDNVDLKATDTSSKRQHHQIVHSQGKCEYEHSNSSCCGAFGRSPSNSYERRHKNGHRKSSFSYGIQTGQTQTSPTHVTQIEHGLLISVGGVSEKHGGIRSSETVLEKSPTIHETTKFVNDDTVDSEEGGDVLKCSTTEIRNENAV